MSNIQGNKNGRHCPACPDVRCYDDKCRDACDVQRDRIAEVKAKAEQQWTTLMQRIEQLPDAQQEKIIECGMRMRELACYYGPYFTQALMLTSAEIGAGRLIMPKVANCDEGAGFIFPGLQSVDQVKNPKIIVPGVKGHS